MRDTHRLAAHLDRLGHATTRALLLRDGIDDADIRHAVRTGALVQVRRGAYVCGDDLPTLSPEQRAARRAVAVARASDESTVIANQSALAAWGLPVLLPEDDDVHMVQLDGAHENQRGRLRHHVAPAPTAAQPLPPPWSDVRVVDPAVAVAQVAMRRGTAPALAAADAALRAGLATLADLDAAVELSQLVKNRHVARRVVALADGRAESPGESLTRLRLHELGVARLDLQVDIRDADGFIGRVDILVGDRGVVEFDGKVKYRGAAGEALWLEKRREDRLRRRGYCVARVTWPDLGATGALARILRESGILPLAG